MSELPLLHSIPESRRLLGDISNTFFYELVRAGDLKLTKLGSRSFVTQRELERFVATREEAVA